MNVAAADAAAGADAVEDTDVATVAVALAANVVVRTALAVEEAAPPAPVGHSSSTRATPTMALSHHPTLLPPRGMGRLRI